MPSETQIAEEIVKEEIIISNVEEAALQNIEKVRSKAIELGLTDNVSVVANNESELSVTEDATWQFWLKFNQSYTENIDVENQIVLGRVDLDSQNALYSLEYSPEHQKLIFDIGGDTTSTEMWSVPNGGVWSHVALVKDGANVNIYIDGEDKTSNTDKGTHGDAGVGTNAAFYFGRDSNHYSLGVNTLDGLIDDFSLWNQALSQENIQEWMYKDISGDHDLVDGGNNDALVMYHDFESLNDGGSGYLDVSGDENHAYGEGAWDEEQSPKFAIYGNGTPYDNGSGLVINDKSFINEESDSIIFSHDSGDAFFNKRSDQQVIQSELGREWFIEVKDNDQNGGEVSLTFDFTDFNFSLDDSQTYAIGVKSLSSDHFTLLNATEGDIVDQKISFDVSVDDIDHSYITLLRLQNDGLGSMLDFTTSFHHIELDANVFELENQATFEMWLNSETLGNGEIIFILETDDVAPRFRVETLGDQIYINHGGVESYSSENVLALNEWNHLAISKDGNTLSLYVNGEDVTSVSSTGSSLNYSDLKLRIGGPSNSWPSSGQGYFLDEFRIWNTNLDQNTIKNWMHLELDERHVSYDGTESDNLVFYLNGDDIVGDNIIDHSGDGHHGKIINGLSRTNSSAPIKSSYFSNNETAIAWGNTISNANSPISSSALNLANITFLDENNDHLLFFP